MSCFIHGDSPVSDCNSLQNNSVSLTAAETEAMPSNCLIVNGARAAWTISNRDLALALYESWRRAHLLRSQVVFELERNQGQSDTEFLKYATFSNWVTF